MKYLAKNLEHINCAELTTQLNNEQDYKVHSIISSEWIGNLGVYHTKILFEKI